MIFLDLIGIGTGNPDHLTGAAIRALGEADLVLIPSKGAGKADLADIRRDLLDKLVPALPKIAQFDMPIRDSRADYRGAVEDWHEAIAKIWTEALATYLPQGGRAALMVWGDPSLYDSTLRIAEHLNAAGLGLKVRVVPGLTSLQLLTAAHAIPLNALAGAVTITTGRLLRDHGWPQGVDSLAVMLDAGGAYEVLDPEAFDIWWGANLGLPQEKLVAGPLGDVAARIKAERAALREAHGWVMDVYLLRRRGVR
jgi:precorrin-6A synthase